VFVCVCVVVWAWKYAKIKLKRILNDIGVLDFSQMRCLVGEIFQFYARCVSMWMIENFNMNVQLSKVYCELQIGAFGFG